MLARAVVTSIHGSFAERGGAARRPFIVPSAVRRALPLALKVYERWPGIAFRLVAAENEREIEAKLREMRESFDRERF